MANGQGNEKKVLMIVGGVIFVLWTLMGVFWFLQNNKLKKQTATYKDQEVKKVEKVREADREDAVQAQLTRMQGYLEENSNLFPEKDNNTEVIREINQMSFNAKMYIESIRPRVKEEKVHERFYKRYYAIQGQGSFLQIILFLNEVEKLKKPFLAVNAIQIEAFRNGTQPGVEGKGAHKLTLELVTYRRIPKAELEEQPPP